MLSRKYYKLLAHVIKSATDLGDPNTLHKDQLLSQLVVALKEDNPAFDGFKFIEACN